MTTSPLRRALANSNYRLLLAGQLVSQSGSWMQRVAQAGLVLDLTDSPVALGAVTTLQFLPILILSLFAGALADRYPKRRMLVIIQVIATAQTLTLTALVVSGQVELWHVLLLAMLQGITNAMEQPLRQAFPAELVGRELVASAVAVNSMVFNVARIAGPALGGLVVAVLGIGGAFLLNGVSYIFVLVALLLMRIERPAVPAPRRAGNTLTQIHEALGFAAHDRILVFSLGTLSVLGIFGFNYSTFLPLLSRYELNLGREGYGWLSAALGVGAVVGSALVAQAGRGSPRRQIVGGVTFSLALLSLAVAPSVLLSFVLMGLLGLTSVLFTTTANTTVQLSVPDAMRGRIMGLYTLLLAGMTPPGATVTGFLADRWGIRAALGIEAALCLTGVLLGWAYLTRVRQRIPAPATT